MEISVEYDSPEPVLYCKDRIIEADGNIRVWYPDSEETFFGKECEIVYEVTKNKYKAKNYLVSFGLTCDKTVRDLINRR